MVWGCGGVWGGVDVEVLVMFSCVFYFHNYYSFSEVLLPSKDDLGGKCFFGENKAPARQPRQHAEGF